MNSAQELVIIVFMVCGFLWALLLLYDNSYYRRITQDKLNISKDPDNDKPTDSNWVRST